MLEFETRGDKEYEVKIIINSMVYGQHANNNQMPGPYYFVLYKGYLKKENIWEPLSAVIYLRKLVNTFYKKYLEKLTVIPLPLDSALPIARPTVPKQKPKQKHDRPSKGANKQSRK